MLLSIPSVFAAGSVNTAAEPSAEYRPELSQAQINALKRIAQLTEVEWQPVLKNTLPAPRGGFFTGEPVTGVPYSSARFPGRRIGYDISLETFMTAVQNPKSVLYTEDLGREPYGLPNTHTFYGLACSSFAQWAFRDDFSYGTGDVYKDPERANMRLLEEQSADGVQVLDLLNTAGPGHMLIITDVTYRDGKPASIEVTELTTAGDRPGTRRITYTPEETLPNQARRYWPGTRRITYTPEEFNEFIKARPYLLYRYDIPDEIPYTPSKYVAVWDEEPQEIVYNRVLALDRGNRTNYEKGLPVKFNIMDENAASLVVKRDGAVADTTVITGTGVIEKNYPDCGRYSAHCVMKDGSKSDPVEFIIAEVKIDVPDEVVKGETLVIKFSAETCRPRILTGLVGSRLDMRSLTEQEISDGSLAVPVPEKARSRYSIIIKGTNEFGSVYSNVGQVDTR